MIVIGSLPYVTCEWLLTKRSRGCCVVIVLKFTLLVTSVPMALKLVKHKIVMSLSVNNINYVS